MPDFFSTPERLLALHNEVEAWLGTPFWPNHRIKGVGVSCQKLVGSILHDCGFSITEDQITDGPMSWSDGSRLIEEGFDITLGENMENLLGTAVGDELAGGCTAAPLLLQPGDIVGFRVGRAVKHCGIMATSDTFCHVMRHSRVCVQRIDDATWIGRLARAWRPLE